MTEAEIMKALEICSQNDTNKHYMLTYHGMPLHILFEAIVDLINRKNAECKDLQNQLSIFKKLLDKAEAEILRLEDAKNAYKDIVDTCEAGARAKAIKEVLQNVEKLKYPNPMTMIGTIIYGEDFDQIAKEMGVEL